MCRGVAVASNGDNAAAQITIQPQQLGRRHGIGQAIPMGGRVYLDPLAIGYNDFQNFCNQRLDLFKGVNACLIVSFNQVHVAQDTIVFVYLDDIQHFLIVSLIVLLLCPSLLEVLCPELLILHLVDRKDDKVKGIAAEKRLKLRDRVNLDAKLHPHFDINLPGEQVPNPLKFQFPAGIVHVGQRFSVTVENFLPAVPVNFHTVIHMIRDADFIQMKIDCILNDLFHRIDGIVAELCMNMIICQHIKTSLHFPYADTMMDYNVNGEIIKLHKGEGIFVNARQIHFGFSASKTECNFVCVILHPMLLCSVPAYEHDFVLPVVRNHGVPFVFLTSDIDWQNSILEQIYLMDQCKDQKAAPLKVQSAFSVIWSLLYENLPLEDHAAVSASSDLTAARNMIGFIQNNYTRRISLKEIALSGAVGQSKCCKLFAKYFGQTPNTYLNQYRLNKSLELLQNGDMTITEIALSVGFGGASYYAETFRKCFGKSPTEYRNCI